MKLSHVIEGSPPDRKHQVKGIKKHMAQKKGKDKIPKTYVDKKTGKRKKTNPWALAWAQYDKYGVPSRIEKDQKRGLMPINNGTKRCVSVVLRDQKDLEHALRLLKRKFKRENFYVQLRRIEFYQKPSEIKKAKATCARLKGHLQGPKTVWRKCWQLQEVQKQLKRALSKLNPD